MKEVNSLCTDSRLLRVEYCIVSFHTIQPSSLINSYSVVFDDVRVRDNINLTASEDCEVSGVPSIVLVLWWRRLLAIDEIGSAL